jgi:hypothetical protein
MLGRKLVGTWEIGKKNRIRFETMQDRNIQIGVPLETARVAEGRT